MDKMVLSDILQAIKVLEYVDRELKRELWIITEGNTRYRVRQCIKNLKKYRE